MKINLNLLPVEIDTDFNVPEEFYEKLGLLGSDLHVKGRIKYDLANDVLTDLDVSGNLYLEDAVTLEKVSYPINIKIAENLSEFASDSLIFDKFNKNLLDLSEFLWENIVLEVPISFSKSTGKNIKGNGWELNKEDTEEIEDERFLKLKEIFKGGE